MRTITITSFLRTIFHFSSKSTYCRQVVLLCFIFNICSPVVTEISHDVCVIRKFTYVIEITVGYKTAGMDTSSLRSWLINKVSS